MRHFLWIICCVFLSNACNTGLGGTNAPEPPVAVAPADANALAAPPPPVANPNTAAAPDPNHPASGPLIRLLGRFDSSDANRIGFAWPASAMLTRVQGTGVTISLSDPNAMTYLGAAVHNLYDVFVDGARTNTIQIVPGISSYVAASDLPYGDHIIKVVKRTEAQMGPAIFGGFTPLKGGTLLPAPQAAGRRIEFIGDSITAGYGADGNVATATGCPFTSATENADQTFASMTAAALNAEFYAIAFSGKGLVQNDDCYRDAYYTLPVLYSSIVPIGNAANQNDADFVSWAPQVVVINLGTNDYNQDNGCGVPSSATFTQGWVRFVRTIRGHYPNAVIFATVGPELHKSQLAIAQASIASAVATLKSAGDTKVFALTLPEDTGANGYGCAGHPNRATHAAMSQVVTAAIQQQLGW